MSWLKKVKNKMINSNNRFVKNIGLSLSKLHNNFVRSRFYYFIKTKPWLSDKKYIEKVYKKVFGVKPDLENPKNFNEKNNWRKLYERNDNYTLMVDKYKLKQIVKEKCGENHFIPLIGVWNDPGEIDFSSLPDKFVLKANHAGGVIVCRSQKTFDKKSAIKELKNIQKKNYYFNCREWPYKNVEKKIICEKYVGENLIDFKNYCFGGKLLYTFVWKNKSKKDGRKPNAYFCGAYDREWVKTTIDINYPSENENIPKPENYQKMVDIAERLSKDIPFVRVDCYVIDGEIFVGEMTFFPWGGFQKFNGEYWNNYLGNLLCLPLDK